MTAEMKKRPFCAEEILAEAVKCKHCGSEQGWLKIRGAQLLACAQPGRACGGTG